MDDYEIVISDINLAMDKLGDLVNASKSLQITNEKLELLVNKIDSFWSTEDKSSLRFIDELRGCSKKINTICSCDNELASAIDLYISAFDNTDSEVN